MSSTSTVTNPQPAAVASLSDAAVQHLIDQVAAFNLYALPVSSQPAGITRLPPGRKS